MAIDPKWPVVDEAVSFPATVSTGPPLPWWVSMISRTNDISSSQSIRRGRQYELNTVQTGEFTPTLSNLDGALSPLNTSGPYYASMQPYSAYRKRMQFPPSINLWTLPQASCGSLPAAVGSGALLSSVANLIFSSQPAAAYVALASGGFNGYGTAVTALATTASGPLYSFAGASAFPGQSHAVSFYVAQNSAGTTTLPVNASIGWMDCTGAPISTPAGSTVTLTAWSSTYNWQKITVIATAPANVGGFAAYITNISAGAGNLLVGGAQFELNTSASAFSQPGVWY